MFKFLKEKLKGAISKFSSRAQEEGEQKTEEVSKEQAQALQEKQEQREELKKQAEEFKDSGKEEEPASQIQIEEEPRIEEQEDQSSDFVETTELDKLEETLEHEEEIERANREGHPELQEEKQEEQAEEFEPKEKPAWQEKGENEAIDEEAEASEVQEAPKEEFQTAKVQKQEEKKGFFSKLFKKKEDVKPKEEEQTSKERAHSEQKKEPIQATPFQKQAEPLEAKKQVEAYQTIEKKEEAQKQGFFSKLTQTITTTKISSVKFEELFQDLEITLLENNVAFEVIEKIKADLQKDLVDIPIKRTKVEDTIIESLRVSIEDLFKIEGIDLERAIKSKQEKPYTIAFFGINGSGKTTSIAKLAHSLQKKGFSCVLAAGDTFRAAAVEQLEHHGNALGIKVIKHGYGAEPAAVAFDAIKHAQSKNADVVLIDTAGRLHSNTNLLKEMEKIIRISKPDLKLFIGESITGNDCVEQAQAFNNAVGIDGLILTKADVDEKGGAAISISYVTKKPILYLGMGQGYDDLKEFDSRLIVDGLGL